MKESTTLNSIAGWTQCIPIKPPTMPMPPTSAITSSRKRVFDSVFASTPGTLHKADSDHVSAPAVAVDPLAAATAAAGKTRRQPHSDHDDEKEEKEERETGDRAWNAATRFLAIPDRGLAGLGAFQEISEEKFLKRWNRFTVPDKKTADALAYLISREGGGGNAAATAGQGGIVNWYGREIRRHFLKNFRDGLHDVCFFRDFSESYGLLTMYSYWASVRRKACYTISLIVWN